MAENPLLDLAQTVMIEKYGLNELEYALVSFTDGAKAVSIKMSDGYIPLSAAFPREFLKFEEMKRWTEAKKEAYVRYALDNDMEIPEPLLDSFHSAMVRVELNPTVEDTSISKHVLEFMDGGGSATLTISKDGIDIVDNMDDNSDAEETVAEEPAEKVEKVKKKPTKAPKKKKALAKKTK